MMFSDIIDFSVEYGGTSKPVNAIKPLVTVCIFTFNQQAYIGKCLDSILEQKTSFDLEILIGEDDSSDGTREICKAYADKHPDKIRLMLRSEKNKWFINGRKTGRFNYVQNLKQSRGKYIAWCDGDDYWCNPNKLEEQVGFLEQHPEYVLSFHECLLLKDCVFEPSLYYQHRKTQVLKPEEINATLSIPTASVCFRNDFEWNFSQWFFKALNGDSVLFSYLVSKTGALSYYHKSLDKSSVYRLQSQGIWSAQNKYSQLTNTQNTLICIRKSSPGQHLGLLHKKLLGISGSLAIMDLKNRKFGGFFKNYRLWFGNARYGTLKGALSFHKKIISSIFQK